MEYSLSAILFEPMLPWWVLLPLCGVIILVGVLNWRFARVMLGLALLMVLSGPVTEQKTLRPEKDVVVLVEDTSPSNDIAPRSDIRAEAAASLRQQLMAMENVEPVVLQTDGNAARGSDLFNQIRGRLGSIPQGRLSAVVAITDGALSGIPDASQANLFGNAPLHVISTSAPDLFDRQLLIHRAPSFGLLGKELAATIEVKDTRNPTATVTMQVGNRAPEEFTVPTNEKTDLTFTLDRGGSTALRLRTPVMEGELTGRNNQAVKLMTGVRENLNVLLVSGLPHNGTQVIRSLLKSDPAINLVHFTILRTMGKIDPTPDDELALIPFPVQDLFSTDLPKFDLVVFDRYIHRGFIRQEHFRNIIQHVRGGRAMLVLAGPDYNQPFELPATPLQDIMPVKPVGDEQRSLYTPTLSEMGTRHPITEPFSENQGAWGPFASVLPTQKTRGRTLMQSPNGQPLLVTSTEGDGRVAVWLSNNWWYWSRGIEGGGPQTQLLRRLTHWLMRQPELEERRIDMTIDDDTLRLAYRDVDKVDEMAVTITPPGGEPLEKTLTAADNLTTTVPARENGLYSAETADGDVIAYAVKGQVRDLEWRVAANQPPLETLANATGGYYVPADDATRTTLRRVGDASRLYGPGWLGLPERNTASLEGTSQKPLIPMPLGLLLILLAIIGTWWLEAVRTSK